MGRSVWHHGVSGVRLALDHHWSSWPSRRWRRASCLSRRPRDLRLLIARRARCRPLAPLWSRCATDPESGRVRCGRLRRSVLGEQGSIGRPRTARPIEASDIFCVGAPWASNLPPVSFRCRPCRVNGMWPLCRPAGEGRQRQACFDGWWCRAELGRRVV
jgi:hypothetical protein